LQCVAVYSQVKSKVDLVSECVRVCERERVLPSKVGRRPSERDCACVCKRESARVRAREREKEREREREREVRVRVSE